MYKVYPKIFLNRLKNTSLYKVFLNNIFLVALFVLFFLLLLNNIIAFLPFGIFGYYLFQKNKTLFKAALIVITIISLHYLFLEITVKPDFEANFSGKVIALEKKEIYQKLTIKNGHLKLIIYDNDFLEITAGDIIEGRGTVLEANPARIEGGFDYQQYLKRRKIVKIVRCEEMQIIERSFSLHRLKYYFQDYLEKNFQKESLVFIKAMLIGDDDSFSEEFKEAVAKNGILHLFAVSGLHIIIFVEIINKILQFFKLRENIIDYAICIFLFYYLIITGFTASVLRAALMYYFSLINKRLKLGFSSLDVISFCFLLLILINPYYMYDYGFILSFLASLVIILLSPLIANKGHFHQIFLISFFAMLVTLPVVINLNNDINLLSPLTNVIFIDLIEVIVLPLSLLVFVFPFLGGVYRYLVIAFKKVTIIVAKYLYLPLRLPSFNIFSTLLYYSLLVAFGLLFYKRKYRNLLLFTNLLFILFSSNLNCFKFSGEVNFLDLYNGEAILIQLPCNDCTVLIDTGDGSNNEVTNYLKRKGIKKLDYLFLTHNHNDHNGEANSIVTNFLVKKIVVSAYDDSEIGSFENIERVQAGDRVNCGKVTFHILHPDKNYQDENDKSIVIFARFGNYNFLFLGDVSRKIEEKLLAYDLDVDVVKIGHHGSKSSTSPEFITKIKPRYAIIQTGRNEKFGFPHSETIMTLENNDIIIYRTDYHYSIKYRFQKNGSIFETVG